MHSKERMQRKKIYIYLKVINVQQLLPSSYFHKALTIFLTLEVSTIFIR